MKKEERIKRYGKAAYEKMLQQHSDWMKQHSEEVNATNRRWQAANPKKVRANEQESNRKGGKRYERKLKYNHTGLQGERNKIRVKHANQYRPFKNIIAPDSEIQHEWLPGTAKYRGVALVEKDQHRHGIIDVIQILEGEITLFTEKEIREQVI